MYTEHKEVDFTKCKSCIHYKKNEDEEPCNECLNIHFRWDSHTPVFYEGEESTK